MPLSFLPNDRLVFQLSRNDTPEATLQISNLGPSCFIFKVKTTTPDRYLVKPNHGLIHPNAVDKISIVVAQTRRAEIVAHAKLDNRMQCADKFLVQSTMVDLTLACGLEGKTSSDLADAVTRLLNKQDKSDLYSKKLFVSFACPSFAGDVKHSNSGAMKKSVPKPSLEATTPLPIPGTPEAMFSEIVALRKKYDDLVAFAVRLTAERDSLSNDLRTVRDNTREAKKPSMILKGNPSTPRLDWLRLFAAAALAFFLGHIMSRHRV